MEEEKWNRDGCHDGGREEESKESGQEHMLEWRRLVEST